jgi:hypothetical protein
MKSPIKSGNKGPRKLKVTLTSWPKVGKSSSPERPSRQSGTKTQVGGVAITLGKGRSGGSKSAPSKSRRGPMY